MQGFSLVADFFEMIAAIAALGVTFLMYREVRRHQDKDKDH